jgi:DSF synthase
MRGPTELTLRPNQETGDEAFQAKAEPAMESAVVPLHQSGAVETLADALVDRIQERWLQSCRNYRELRIEFEPADSILWCFMDPKDRPCVTSVMVREGRVFQDSVKQLFSDLETRKTKPIRYIVWGSQHPGVFNLGGDLNLFASLIREQDRDTLLDYAITCIDVVYNNIVSLELPIINISLVEGDALGGGFEKALSTNVMVAERGTKFGLPEVLFNLFPGMGAYSLLARRIGNAQAKRMVLSGRIYTAEALYEMGLVDVLAEPGQGRQAVYDYISRHSRRHTAECAVFEAGRRVNPVTYGELKDIAVMWVDTALGLTESDLRKMERLAAAQERRRTLDQNRAASSKP